MSTHVTVPSVTPRIQYVADGTQTAFPYPFVVFRDADLQVFLGEVVQSTGYTVSGAGSADGGTVTFAAPPPADTLVTLRRRVTILRTSDFQEGGAFRAKVINDELDFQTAALQQLEVELSRAVAIGPTSTLDAAPTLPAPAAGKAIGWSDDGTRLVNDPTDFTSTVAVVQQWATNAEGSVTTAQTAATHASASASAAAGSASAAATAQEAAATSADAAAASESAVAASAAFAGVGRLQSEAHATDAAFAVFQMKGDRDATIAAAAAAAISADAAEVRAAEALGRLEETDIQLWRADRAAERAERAADRRAASVPAVGITPAAVLPNWARISS